MARPGQANLPSPFPCSPSQPQTNAPPPPATPVFNLTEGIDVKENEARVEAYRAVNADSIAANEAARAEEVRAAAARELAARDPGPEAAAVSGTAAAFQGGRDAEPHQGTEYTAAMPSGFLAQQG